MSGVTLSHSDPLFLLVETRAALESSELNMSPGLVSSTGSSPVCICTGITGPFRYGAI